MEAALTSVADELVVCVHSHNVAHKSGPGPLLSLYNRIALAALSISSSPLRRRIHLADPRVVHGIQNPIFDEIASSMISRGAVPWIIMGRDAVKPTYRQQMRHLSHGIIDRPPYEDQSKGVLTGRVVRLEQSEPLELCIKSRPDIVAKLYDARAGAFHHVISLGEDSWPYGVGSVEVLFSRRVEDHPYTSYLSFDVPSYVARDRESDQWSLFKTPVHVELQNSTLKRGDKPRWHLS
jgi:hypothetical protein